MHLDQPVLIVVDLAHLVGRLPAVVSVRKALTTKPACLVALPIRPLLLAAAAVVRHLLLVATAIALPPHLEPSPPVPQHSPAAAHPLQHSEHPNRPLPLEPLSLSHPRNHPALNLEESLPRLCVQASSNSQETQSQMTCHSIVPFGKPPSMHQQNTSPISSPRAIYHRRKCDCKRTKL